MEWIINPLDLNNELQRTISGGECDNGNQCTPSAYDPGPCPTLCLCNGPTGCSDIAKGGAYT